MAAKRNYEYLIHIGRVQIACLLKVELLLPPNHYLTICGLDLRNTKYLLANSWKWNRVSHLIFLLSHHVITICWFSQSRDSAFFCHLPIIRIRRAGAEVDIWFTESPLHCFSFFDLFLGRIHRSAQCACDNWISPWQKIGAIKWRQKLNCIASAR